MIYTFTMVNRNLPSQSELYHGKPKSGEWNNNWGEYKSLSINGALIGGIGLEIGVVTDALGNSRPFFTFNGNLGIGGGISLNAGILKPTMNNEPFLAEDLAGFGAGYSASGSYGIGVDLNYGGSLQPGVSGIDKFNPKNFGTGKRGYTTETIGSGFSGPGVGVGVMINYSRTWVW